VSGLLGSEESSGQASSGTSGATGTSGESKGISLEDLSPSLIRQLRKLLRSSEWVKRTWAIAKNDDYTNTKYSVILVNHCHPPGSPVKKIFHAHCCIAIYVTNYIYRSIHNEDLENNNLHNVHLPHLFQHYLH